MSRAHGSAALRPSRFPRVSGDEPTADSMAEKLGLFSPRERG